ncbi:hypothetical protein FOWG_16908 [Fusarium oxysporum f. sp. lycopersici MN25]|nr:hypothetical protein FOWG_16908 [Fusarium oxysporum f. sp. lycopersici MN25]
MQLNQFIGTYALKVLASGFLRLTTPMTRKVSWVRGNRVQPRILSHRRRSGEARGA